MADHPWADKDWESLIFRIVFILVTGFCYADGRM